MSWTVAHRRVVVAGVPDRGRRRRGRRRGAAGPRAVPEGRRRPVPAPRPPAAGDPLRADPPGRAEDARRDRRGGRAGQHRHHDGLRRRRTRRSSPSTWPTSGAGAPTTACSASASARGARSASSSSRRGCARPCRRRSAPGSAASCSRLGLTAEQADQRVGDLVFAFEPGDLISETMSLGAPAPIEVVVSGRNLADSSAFMDRLRERVRRDRVAPRRPGPAVAPLPDRAGHPRPRAGRPQRRDRPRHRRIADRGHLLQPLHLAQLLARRRQRQLVPGPGAGPAAEDDRRDRRGARAADDRGQPPAGGAGGRLALQPHAAAPDPRRGPRHAQRDARRGRPLQHAALPQPDGQRRGGGPRPRDRPARRGDRPRRPAAQGDRGRAPRPGPADEADVPEPGDRPGRGRGRDPDHADRLLPGPPAGPDGRGVGAGGPRRRRAGALGHAARP